MTSNKRTTYLIQPQLQTKLVGSFVGLAILALLLQFLLLGMRLIPMVRGLPQGSEVATALPAALLQVMVFSMILVTPLIFGLGIRMTLKIAGPLYRFESFLREVGTGERSEPCKLRKDDELHVLCELLNEATAERRARNSGASRKAA